MLPFALDMAVIGVDAPVADDALEPLVPDEADALAAFSANLFCLDAEGAMVIERIR